MLFRFEKEKILRVLNYSTNCLYDNESKEQLIEIINNKSELWESNCVRITLCGRFNAGKSAVINALLDEKVVISKIVPATGVVTRIYHSELSKYKVIHDINGQSNETVFSYEQINQFTVKNNSTQGDNIKDIIKVEIGIPNELLKHRVELFDTPGLYDTLEMDKITFGHMDKSDFIVFVIDALELQKIEDLIGRYYNYLGKNIVFVINKMDMIRKESDKKVIEELSKVYFAEYYNTLSFSTGLFFVSANEDDPDVIAFSDFFRNYLIENSSKIPLISRMSIIKYECDEVYRRLKSKIAECDDLLKICPVDEKRTIKEQRTKLVHDRQIIGDLIQHLIGTLKDVQINN